MRHTQTIGAYTQVLWPVLQSRSAETNKKMDTTPPAPDRARAHDIALDVAREAALDVDEARNIALEALNAYEARNVALDVAIDVHEARNAADDDVLAAAIEARNAALEARNALDAHETALVALVAVYATHARRRQGTV